MNGFSIAVPGSPEENKEVGEALDAFNLQQVPADLPGKWIVIQFVAKNDADEIIGGIQAALGYWGGLEIQRLWVREDYRRKGIGNALLKRAEEAAREKGATLSIVDTFSFHAPEFYRVNGYELFGTLNDFPKGHTRYYFSKKLY